MGYDIVVKDGVKYIRTSGQWKLETEQDAVDLIGACGENEARGIMLCHENLADGFFSLRTGLAGAVLGKFATYYVIAAAVIPPEVASSGKFGEFAVETNRGKQFRIFSTIEAAEDWLIKAEPYAPSYYG